ncbi:secreted effector protein PipB2 [Yersinia intermedia]|uniref:pentapeptide repeat-containing protein n=1 Tax=Yersinia intermedia TaxID=631 RepID=UPI0005E18F08|nr:pentapeptide repeat-containing protein [Yersinia intermedia]CNC79592.1 secreted effector protein PipB2 [Yersinia intermedia]CNH24780.1 secreted effector protein PipB2 [Yersinia intermedia]
MFKRWFDKIRAHPLKNIVIIFFVYFIIIVTWSLFFPWLSTWFFPKTEIGIYNKGFWSDLLVNLNASSFDFFVFGIILFFFEKRRERNENNKDLLNNLIDISKYNSLEINLKKVGILRRLNEMKIYEITVHRMNISGTGDDMSSNAEKAKYIEIRDIKFKESDLTGLVLNDIYMTNSEFVNTKLQAISLIGSKLKNVTFNNCNMRNAIFSHAKFHNVTLINCNLTKASFRSGEFKSCIFKNCDMNGAIFDVANMNRANLRSVTNLDEGELCRAKNLDYVVVDDDMKLKIKTLKKDVKFSS